MWIDKDNGEEVALAEIRTIDGEGYENPLKRIYIRVYPDGTWAYFGSNAYWKENGLEDAYREAADWKEDK